MEADNGEVDESTEKQPVANSTGDSQRVFPKVPRPIRPSVRVSPGLPTFQSFPATSQSGGATVGSSRYSPFRRPEPISAPLPFGSPFPVHSPWSKASAYMARSPRYSYRYAPYPRLLYRGIVSQQKLKDLCVNMLRTVDREGKLDSPKVNGSVSPETAMMLCVDEKGVDVTPLDQKNDLTVLQNGDPQEKSRLDMEEFDRLGARQERACLYETVKFLREVLMEIKSRTS